MTEKEMEDLLWEHPRKFFDQSLAKFKRQPRSAVGRADLVFETSSGGLLVIEVKKGRLPRLAPGQVLDYWGMMKDAYPQRSVDLMVVANVVPRERRYVCERLGVKWMEISEEQFRNVAIDHGYVFVSERDQELPTPVQQPTRSNSGAGRIREPLARHKLTDDVDFGPVPDTAWYGLASTYREAVGRTTEASDNYHLAGFLLATGAGLGRYVFLEGLDGVRIYPNFYLFIVGRGTWSRKDTAIDRVEKLITEASPDVEFLHSLPSSKQGLIRDVSGVHEEARCKPPTVVIREGYYTLRYLFQNQRRAPTEVGQLLTSLFDSPEHIESASRPTEGHRTPRCLSLVANANAYPRLQSPWGGQLELHLARCFMFVPGDPKPPMAVPDPISEMYWDYLVLKLGKAFDFWRSKGGTPMSLSDGARSLWGQCCASLPQTSGSNYSLALSSRSPEQMLRVAMVHASLDLTDRIEEVHMHAATSLCEYLVQSLGKIFGDGESEPERPKKRLRRLAAG